jgi:guanyl-specific ribonuclease Sa
MWKDTEARERIATLEGQVAVLSALVPALVQHIERSSQATPMPQAEDAFLPTVVRDTLRLINAGKPVPVVRANIAKAEREWAQAKQAGTATDEFAKRLAAEIHRGGARVIDEDGTAWL